MAKSRPRKGFVALRNLTDRLLAVPHAEQKKRIEAHRAEASNPNKRGLKPKA